MCSVKSCTYGNKSTEYYWMNWTLRFCLSQFWLHGSVSALSSVFPSLRVRHVSWRQLWEFSYLWWFCLKTGLYKYISYLINSVFWKDGLEKEGVGLGFPPTNEPIINKRHSPSPNSSQQLRDCEVLCEHGGFCATFCSMYEADLRLQT